MEPQRDPEGVETAHLEKLGFSKNDRLLEIGCGSGRLTWRCLPLVDSIVGIDIDRQDLLEAEKTRSARGLDSVSFLESSAEHLPFAPNSYEAVILAWSL